MGKNVINIPVLFGQNLKKYRKNAGLTQEELSEKLEVTQKHLSMLETGTQFASASLIAKICSVLDLEPASLFETGINQTEANKLYSRLATHFENRLNQMQAVLLSELKK